MANDTEVQTNEKGLVLMGVLGPGRFPNGAHYKMESTMHHSKLLVISFQHFPNSEKPNR